MTASSRQESSTTTLIQPTKISDLRPGWIGDAYFRALVEVKSSDLEEESSTTTVKKAQQQQQQQKEFLVGDASAKITFRCSDKREAETIKPNEIYHLQSGKIEMIRGQMRLMTDRKTYDKSAVAPVAPGQVSLLPPEADVPKAKDCGAMDLSVLFFERIQ